MLRKGHHCLVISTGCALFLWFTACGHSTTGDGPKAQSVAQSPTVGVKTSPADMSVGDLMWVEFNASGAASVSFSGVSSSSQFQLLIQSTATSTSSSTFTLGSVSVGKGVLLPDPAVAQPAESSAEEILHNLLRGEEVYLSENHVPEIDAAFVKSLSAPSVAKAVSVGATETFRVLSSLSSTSQYTTVTAEARCVSGEVAVYVDTRMSGSTDLTESDISTLCTSYAEDVKQDKTFFGSVPDLNNDSAVVALLTPAVNSLGASGGGIVTGFFYAGDLFERSSSIPASNYREIVYLMVPDPDGKYGTAISRSFALSNLLPAVFPHEVQHLISYYQHVFVAAGGSEENWLNECLSHLAEDLVGYGQENPSRYDLFLRSLSSTSLVVTGSPNLQQRGAGYLFCRFLYEQASDSTTFLNRLVQTNRTGVDNVEAAFQGTATDFDEFEEFLKRWGVALAMTNAGLTTDARFVYDDRTKNSSTNHWQGVCLDCTAEDGRGTVLTGPATTTYSGSASLTVNGTGTRILDIANVPDTLSIQSSTSSAMQGVLIRTQ